MRWLFKISLRYLISGRGSTNLVSLIALLGVSIGVAALLLTMGVFSGFQRELKEKILSTTPHIIISLFETESFHESRIKELKEITEFYPVVLYQGIISKDGRLLSVGIKAMKEEDIRRIYKVQIKEGIAVGVGLAGIMDIKSGQEVLLLSPMGQATPFGFIPKMKSFPVDGIFQKGVFDQDYATVVMTMEKAEELFSTHHQLFGYEVYIKDPYKAQEVRKKLEELLGPSALVRSWIDLNSALFNALQFEKVALSFVLMLMVLIASFNITSLLFMKVREKVRDIAILRTFGLRRRQVVLIFLLQGLILGSTGTLMGLLFSLVGKFLINQYKLIRVPSDIYFMDHIPAYFEIGDILFTLIGAFLLSLISSLLPAYRAGKESIVRVLKNE